MFADVNANFEQIPCGATVMVDALSTARASATEDRAVLVVGERGTGKETVGRYVHHHSTRASGPFIPVDCLTLSGPDSLTELVGRAAGTGRAVRDSLGLFRSASGGTLYLDEVAALDLPTQRAILRVVRTGSVDREGDGRRFAVDVRVIAATTVDLTTWVARGAFLPELHHLWSQRLIRVPALRDRAVDVPDLAHGLLRARAHAFGEGPKSLSAPAVAALRNYGWPGNLPELAQLLHAAAARVQGRQIDVGDLPSPVRMAGRMSASGFVN